MDRTPVWFLRQAGRYMQEYREVRKHHTLVEICKQPELAAEVTITAAEKLGVDAAIIFADLLLPLEPMGLDFEFQAGEGPVVHHPVRTADDVRALRTDRAADLAYVARAIEKVAAHFRNRLGIIGFCGAPYTLASYMIEGGGSRNYIHTKRMMYAEPTAWRSLLDKIVVVLTEYCRLQVEAGADVIQIFDSWVGSLALADYRAYAFEASRGLKGVFAIVGQAERADPTIENLDYIRPGLDLKAAILRQHHHDLVQKAAPGVGLRVHHLLGVDVVARAAALDHVTGQRVGRAAEADDSQPISKMSGHLLNGPCYVSQLGGAVGAQGAYVLGGADRMMHHRPLAGPETRSPGPSAPAATAGRQR